MIPSMLVKWLTVKGMAKVLWNIRMDANMKVHGWMTCGMARLLNAILMETVTMATSRTVKQTEREFITG